MNIFEENMQYRIESGVLLNADGEEIAHCTDGVAFPPKSLCTRLVMAKVDGTWGGNYIPAGTITKIKYDIPSTHSWYLLIGDSYVPFYKDELIAYFEPIND